MSRLDATTGEQWNEMAKIYEKMTTGTAAKPMGVMLARANTVWPFSQAEGILDNGCGPGPIMARLLKEYDVPASCALTCADFSEGMVQAVRNKRDAMVAEDGGSVWKRVEAVVQDAMDLREIGDGSRSHVTAGWVYFMTPDPQKCLSESRRVLKPGGVLVCSSWHGSEWMDLMSRILDVFPGKNFPAIPENWRNVGPMKAELEKAGFKDVQAEEVEVEMEVEKTETFVDFCLEKMPHMVMALEEESEEDKARLREYLMKEARKMCPEDPLKMRGVALVAVGRK